MQVYNDLTRKMEELTPQKEGEYRIYVCGPTVYDFFHLGNARPFVIYDTLRRYLEYQGNKVIYVQNFTDVDDKLINRANLLKTTVHDLADQMIEEYFVDADGLGIERASHYPRASEVIEDIVDFVKILENKGFAYVLEDGVYFDTEKFPSYGKLSRLNKEDLEAGASQRGNLNQDKRSPLDFVLWKFKKEGEPAWPSPWGEGRPGWHIECSTMSKKYLGQTLDIHCGGQDLLFPHHENEIAQSEAANDAPFVRFWLHNGFINVNDSKMAKSRGNFFTVRELAKKYSYHALRLFILQTQYRMPINFTGEALEAAEKGYERLVHGYNNLLFLLGSQAQDAALPDLPADMVEDLAKNREEAKSDFLAALDDDLNTAAAVAAVFQLVRTYNTLTGSYRLSKEDLTAGKDLIQELAAVLGFTHLESKPAVDNQVMDLVHERVQAKEAKDYAKADALRAQIEKLGYTVEDTAAGPKVRKL